VRNAAHPKQPKTPLTGGPQMVELSRDGKRIYFTNSLYSPWDAQLYPEGFKGWPEGFRGWMVKVDAKPEGGMQIDPRFFVDFGELRGHQVRLEGGDASSDSYRYA
jgi:selenium-binding protein 1